MKPSTSYFVAEYGSYGGVAVCLLGGLHPQLLLSAVLFLVAGLCFRNVRYQARSES